MSKIEISDVNNEKLVMDAAIKGLSKKDLANQIIAAYYCDDKSRAVLFGFEILQNKLDLKL